MLDLSAQWIGLVGDSPAAQMHGASLLQRWAEPHRRYHDADHLRSVLAHIDELVGAEPGTAGDPESVRLAAFFHDAVYDPTRQDNEAASADLARGALTELGVPGARRAEVVRLVLVTATHDLRPGDGNAAVLCDADLAVLASDPEAYAAYAVAVREEYGHIPEPLFRAGRARVLAGLLEHDPLYRTQTGRSRWEASARRNVGAELILLRAQAGEGSEADAAPPL